ncbi:MAG TPA: sulfite exporter TauE/SafE family protein, partial [Candidatus Manganitrophaceae bacterium]|nr:sulfite exporter TauE/SafE family protein [Candidatus Manganitrophaceae bacterium]
MTEPIFLSIAFFLVALLYASVGHGGASGYLALFVLAGFSRPTIAPIVLALNILVTALGWFYFRRGGHFSFRILAPFIVTSIPAAFLGSQIHLSSRAFSAILFVILFMAAVRMCFVFSPWRPLHEPPSSLLWKTGIPVGFFLGFLAG